jgi:hypothetical protein
MASGICAEGVSADAMLDVLITPEGGAAKCLLTGNY